MLVNVVVMHQKMDVVYVMEMVVLVENQIVFHIVQLEMMQHIVMEYPFVVMEYGLIVNKKLLEKLGGG